MSRIPSRATPDVSFLRLLGLVLLGFVEMPHTATARQSPPVSIPAPVACTVAPRSLDDILVLIETLPADEEFWTLFPPGEPADPPTTAAVTAVVRELEACINTGDFLRVLALFSDDGAMFRGWPVTEEIVAELRDLTATTPKPAPDGQRQMLIGPWGVRLLDDGRVAAAVLFTFEHEVPFAEATKALFFVQRDGRWLIDEWTETVEIPGCELSVDVEQAVSPPPGVTIESWPAGCDEQVRPARRKKRRDASPEESGETG